MQKIFLKWLTRNVSRPFITLLLLTTSFPIFAKKNVSSKELFLINQHRKQIANKEEGVLVGELDDSDISSFELAGKRFIIMLSIIESMGGGNSDEVFLSILETRGDKICVVLDRLVSSRLYGYFDKFKISKDEITLFGKKVGPRDGLCCPSIPHTAVVQLKDNQLILVDGGLLIGHPQKWNLVGKACSDGG